MNLLHFSEKSFFILKSFFSIIVINIKIIYYKFKNKKVIFFYDPENRYTQSINYIEDLFDNFGKEFLIFFGFNYPNISGHKKYYIKYSFLKWIYKVDIFLSNNVCDIFTNNSTLASKYLQKSQEILREARFIDATENSLTTIESDLYTDARL